MKVYVVYNDAEDGIELIDKVFDTERKALDHLIKKYCKGLKQDEWLNKNVSYFIEEKELE